MNLVAPARWVVVGRDECDQQREVGPLRYDEAVAVRMLMVRLGWIECKLDTKDEA